MDDLNALFMRIGADSGTLSGLSAVAHTFDQTGSFTVNIIKDDAPAHTTTLEVAAAPVSDGATAASAAAVAGAMVGAEMATTTIDLAQVAGDALQAVSGGLVVFHALSGDAGHAVVVEPAGMADTTSEKAIAAPGAAPTAGNDASAASPQSFDSRQLGPGDLFSTVLIRPGTYTVANTLSNVTSTITVSYPVVTPGTPYQPPDATTIECNADAFVPGSIALQPAQGAIFRINTPAHITIALTTPDDGPGSRQH